MQLEPVKLVELARAVRSCQKQRELEERRRLLLEESTLVLDLFDLNRCPKLVLAQLIRPEIGKVRYEDDEVFIRSLVRRGVTSLLREAHGPGARVELSVWIDLPVKNKKTIPRSVLPWLKSDIPVERVRIEGSVDAWLPREREALLVYYVNADKNRPPQGHVERSIVLQLLMLLNGYRVERVRLLYTVGLEKFSGEFVVETSLVRSMRARQALLERLERLADRVVSLEKYPLKGWQCRGCPLPGMPGTGCPPGSPGEESGWIEDLSDVLGVRWWRDYTMKAWLSVLDEARRRSMEVFSRYPKRRREKKLQVVRAYPTLLSRCPLRFWFSMYYPVHETGPSISILRGQIIHDGIQHLVERVVECPELAENYGIDDVVVEEPVQDVYHQGDTVYMVTGRIDVLLRRHDGTTDIYEIKTCGPGDRCEPKEWHKNQVSIYGDIIEKHHGKRPRQILYYVSAGSTKDMRATIKGYHHTVNTQGGTLTMLLEDVHQLYTGTLKVTPRYKWECNYCEYKQICPYKEHRTREASRASPSKKGGAQDNPSADSHNRGRAKPGRQPSSRSG